MRPVEHFLSLLDRLEKARGSAGDPSSDTDQAREAAEDHLTREFVSLAMPVIGATAAEDLCATILDRIKEKRFPPYRKLGFIAAFLLDDFDDESMELDDDDWEDIRDTLEDASTDMDLENLTNLMDGLLSRGKLD
jgi:hypothetical protein